MAINKVVYGNTTLLDLTDTTVTADKVLNGEYFYGANGVKTSGTLVIQHYYTGTSEPSSALGSNGDIYLMTEG